MDSKLDESWQDAQVVVPPHVVDGAVMAADAMGLSSAATLLGKDIALKANMGSLYINDAKVVISDIEASNGVIHVIDAVLLPPAEEAAAPLTIVDIAVADGRFQTLVAAVQVPAWLKP